MCLLRVVPSFLKAATFIAFPFLREVKGAILEIMLMVGLSKRDLCNQICRWSFFIDHNFDAQDQF